MKNLNCIYNEDQVLCNHSHGKKFMLFFHPRCIEFCSNKRCDLKIEFEVPIATPPSPPPGRVMKDGEMPFPPTPPPKRIQTWP